MKKLYYYLSVMLLVVAPLMMSSCHDGDVERAVTLSGQWYGDFGMYYTYVYKGHEYTFNSYDTDIIFYPKYDYATHGWGKQVDWYEEGPYEKQYYRFNWEIRDGVIYITYPHDPELNTAIYDYVMDRDFFSGYFDNGGSRFKLRKIADYYDWDCYYDDYYYYDRDHWYDYYGGWTRSAEESIDAKKADGEIVKHGNRFVENK